MRPALLALALCLAGCVSQPVGPAAPAGSSVPLATATQAANAAQSAADTAERERLAKLRADLDAMQAALQVLLLTPLGQPPAVAILGNELTDSAGRVACKRLACLAHTIHSYTRKFSTNMHTFLFALGFAVGFSARHFTPALWAKAKAWIGRKFFASGINK